MKFGANIFSGNTNAVAIIGACREAGITTVRLVGESIPRDVATALFENKIRTYYVPVYKDATEKMTDYQALVKFYADFCRSADQKRSIGIALPIGIEGVVRLTGSVGLPREKVRTIANMIANEIRAHEFASVISLTPGAIACGDWKGLSFGIYEICTRSMLAKEQPGMFEAMNAEKKSYWYGNGMSLGGIESPVVTAKIIRNLAGVKTDAAYGFIDIASVEDLKPVSLEIAVANTDRVMEGDKDLAAQKRERRGK